MCVCVCVCHCYYSIGFISCHCSLPPSLLQSVDVDREAIKLEVAKDSVTAEGIQQHVPTGMGRYHFFRFHHTYEGDYHESIGE